jgi:hypothetical protein
VDSPEFSDIPQSQPTTEILLNTRRLPPLVYKMEEYARRLKEARETGIKQESESTTRCKMAVLSRLLTEGRVSLRDVLPPGGANRLLQEEQILYDDLRLAFELVACYNDDGGDKIISIDLRDILGERN